MKSTGDVLGRIGILCIAGVAHLALLLVVGSLVFLEPREEDAFIRVSCAPDRRDLLDEIPVEEIPPILMEEECSSAVGVGGQCVNPAIGIGGGGVSASTGGNAEPNGRPYGDVFFRHAGVNPFVDTEDDRLSTFALDVDTASYTIARRHLLDGNLPDPDSVRVEESVPLPSRHSRESPSRHFKLCAAVAEFAEILRGSFWARESSLEAVSDYLGGVAEEYDRDGRVEELRDLVDRASLLVRRGCGVVAGFGSRRPPPHSHIDGCDFFDVIASARKIDRRTTGKGLHPRETVMRFASFLVVLVGAVLGLSRATSAHCQIPCGIYDDMLRIRLLEEHVTTLEKSIRKIEALSGKPDAADVNQTVRWVRNKEVHADLMSEIVVEYFLRQRVKAPKADSEAGRKKYTDQLIVLHEILVTTMKAKQTVDTTVPGKLRAQVARFKSLYFMPEDLKHTDEHR